MAQSGSGRGVTDIEPYVRDAKYPADRHELQRVAQQNDAPREVLEIIEALPDGRFQSAAEVHNDLGGPRGVEADIRGEGTTDAGRGGDEGTDR